MTGGGHAGARAGEGGRGTFPVVVYRVDAREGSTRERFITAVTADDFIEAAALFDALPPPAGVAGWLAVRATRRIDVALGDSLAITLRPSRGEVFATWFGRRGLRGVWAISVAGSLSAVGFDDHVTLDPSLDPSRRRLLVSRGVIDP